MTNKFINFFAVAFLGACMFAQEGLPFDEQYFTSENSLINPSLYGSSDDVVVRGSFRKQWSGIDNAPETFIASAHSTIVDRLALGMYLLNDDNGNTSLRGINVGAAYHIPFTDSEDRTQGQFSFGTSLSFMGQQYGPYLFNDQNDLLIADDETNVFVPYLNLGGSVSYKGWFLGASVLDIALSYNSAIANQVEASPTWYVVQAKKNIKVVESFQVEPQVMYRANSRESDSRLDAGLKAKFLFGNNAIWIGGLYRMDMENSEALDLLPSVGFEFNRFHFTYSYGVGLTDISEQGDGTHLFGIGYDFNNFFAPDLR